MTSTSMEFPAAPHMDAVEHFARVMSYETDVWDVQKSLTSDKDFVLVDARSFSAYKDGHLPTAISMPHPDLRQGSVSQWSESQAFVVYGDGNSNDATRAALKLARLGRPVKVMIGGYDAWVAAHFTILKGKEPG